eukprot:SM000026S08953  [mRNA]  locus=s26:623720:626118:- [translate_table: standard]
MSSLLVILYVLFAAAGGADAVTRGHHPPNVEADRHHKTQPTQTVRTGAQYVVAKDGSGTHTSVQEAINAVPANSPSEVVIVLKPGMYREKVHIPSSKPFITLRGSDAFTTTIVYSDWAGMPIASGKVLGTFLSCSVCVDAAHFTAYQITFQDTETTHCYFMLMKNDHRPAPPSDRTHQALAFRISGDMAAFYNCRFLGWQDTCSDHQACVHYMCISAFTLICVQYILQECTLYARAQGAYTAQARSDLSQATGFVFLRCNVTGVSQASPRLSRDLYSLLLFDRRSLHALLGRAWGAAARIIFAYSFLDDTITLGTWGTVGLRVKQAKSSTMIKVGVSTDMVLRQ